MIWIAVLCLVFVGGAIRFVRTAPRGSGCMRVTTVDETGKRVGKSEWVRIQPPDRFPANGAERLRPYVDRLLASPAAFTSVIVFTPDEMRGFSLRKRDGRIALGLIFPRRRGKEEEAKARAFFRSRGIEPETDYVAQGDGTRILDWPLEGDAASIDSTGRLVLTTLCGVPSESGLNVTYKEHRERRRSE